MSLFAPSKKQEQIKVPNSQYIKTENQSDDGDTKPAEQPVNPDQPEAK